MRWRLCSKGRLDGNWGIAMDRQLNQVTTVSRRSFIALGGTAIAMAETGLALPCLADSAEKAPADNPDIQTNNVEPRATAAPGTASLRVEGDRFFINDDIEGARFLNGHLSVMADTANERLVVHFYTPQGEANVATLGKQDENVEVHGEIGTLTVDGISDEVHLTVAKDAGIGVLGVGSIAEVELVGAVDLFIIAGDADAKLAGTSEVGILVLGNLLCEAYIENEAILAEVRGLGLGQLDGPGAQNVPFTEVDEEWVEELCRNQHDEITQLALELTEARTTEASNARANADAENGASEQTTETEGATTPSIAEEQVSAPSPTRSAPRVTTSANHEVQAQGGLFAALFGVHVAHADEADASEYPGLDPDSDDGAQESTPLGEDASPAGMAIEEDAPEAAAGPDGDIGTGTDSNPPEDIGPGQTPGSEASPEPVPDEEASFSPEPGYILDTEEVPDVPDEGKWVVAQEGNGEEPANDYEPDVDEDALEFPPDAAVPTNGPVGEAAATNGVAADLFVYALKTLGSSIAGKAASYGSNALFELVLGKDDQTSRIMEQIGEVQEQLRDINFRVSQIISLLIQLEYATQVNTFMDGWLSKLQTAFDFLDMKRSKIDAMADGDEKAAAQREFAETLYAGTEKGYKIENEPIYIAAKRFVYDMTNPNASTACNLFQAFDRLCLYRYKWEHQGYAVRTDFQNAVLALCTSLMTYSQFCLNEHIEALVADPSASARDLTDALIHWENLFGAQQEFAVDRSDEDDVFADSPIGKCQMATQMAEDDGVVELDSSLRRYQVPGHEVLLCASAAKVKTCGAGKTKQEQMMRDSAGHSVVELGQFKNMLEDYGNGANLVDILFGKGEGNIVAPSDTSLDFVCYQLPLEKESHMAHPSHHYYHEYYAPFISATGSQSRVMLAKLTTKCKILVKSASAIGVFRA